MNTKSNNSFYYCLYYFLIVLVTVVYVFSVEKKAHAAELDIIDYVSINGKKVDFKDEERIFFDKEKLNIRIKLNEESFLDNSIKDVFIDFIESDSLQKRRFALEITDENLYEYEFMDSFKGVIRLCITESDKEKIFLLGKAIVESEENALENMDLILINNKGELINDDLDLDFFASNNYCGIQSMQISLLQNDIVYFDHLLEVDKDENNILPFTFKKEYEDGLVTNIKGTIPVEAEGNDFCCIIKLTDNAGVTIKKEKRFSIDKSSPYIELSHNNIVNPGGYFNKDICCNVIIKDNNFDENNTKVYLIENNNEKLLNLKFEREKENNYFSSININKEGLFKIIIESVDKANNKKRFESEEIILDKTKPIVTYTYNNKTSKGNMINQKRNLIVKVIDDNYDKELVNISCSKGNVNISELIDTGKEHSFILEFEEDGIYELNISGKDKAENSFDNLLSDVFIIDTIKPQIKIENIEKFGAYNKKVNPKIIIEDKYLDDGSLSFYLEKNGESVDFDYKQDVNKENIIIEYFDIPRIKENDGVYKLKVSSTDFAGNNCEETIDFSVNRFGSSYYFNDSLINIKDSYIKNPVSFSIMEVNVDKIDLSKTFCYLSKDEKTRILNPYEDFYVKKESNGYKNSFTYEFPKNLFIEEGMYSLSIYSEDAAGNLNKSIENDNLGLVSFGVDTTAPVIYGINLDNETVINENEFKLKAFIKDNVYVKNKEIYINEKRVDPEISDDEIAITISESDKPIDITIVAEDLAGNKTKENIKNVLIYRAKPISIIKNNLVEKLIDNVPKNNKERYTVKEERKLPYIIIITSISLLLFVLGIKLLWKRK